MELSLWGPPINGLNYKWVTGVISPRNKWSYFPLLIAGPGAHFVNLKCLEWMASVTLGGSRVKQVTRTPGTCRFSHAMWMGEQTTIGIVSVILKCFVSNELI